MHGLRAVGGMTGGGDACAWLPQGSSSGAGLLVTISAQRAQTIMRTRATVVAPSVALEGEEAHIRVV